MEGPVEFIEGIASGTENLVGSAVGGAAGAVSKISGVISKGLATLTFDEDYQSARIQRKELTTSDFLESGKNIVKVCCIQYFFLSLFIFE
jgi:vacuolar protein sorting-associated protein 13A/C